MLAQTNGPAAQAISGSLDGIALKPLTVDFHDVGFGATLNGENGQPFWFQMSEGQRQKAGSPWGPANAQTLNRYSYVLNGPVRYSDPSGHCFEIFSCATEGATIGAAGGTLVAPGPGTVVGGVTGGLVGVVVGAIIVVGAVAGIAYLASHTAAKKDDNQNDTQLEETPDTNPEHFENVRGRSGKKDTETGEIWVLDQFHKNHYEVYKNLKNYEKGVRDRDVWRDGRPKRKF